MPGELEKDRERLFRFVRFLKRQDAKGAVQIVPYGEALIHAYYWRALAQLSRMKEIEAVGAQSNFSFPVEKMLKIFISSGGDLQKLRLWGTFHPEMTSARAFLEQCRKLSDCRVLYCVGAVGDPAQIEEIRKLREKLPESVYLWINQMDPGRTRSVSGTAGNRVRYTETEIRQFQEIDAYFKLELRRHGSVASAYQPDGGKRDPGKNCGNQIFVESDGTMKRCNICRPDGNLYDRYPETDGGIRSWNTARECERERPSCTRRSCGCYLAYNNRNLPQQFFFRPYPAFRIPRYPKAVFLDVDGTLITRGERKLSGEAVYWLRALAKYSRIYLATTLPLEDALRRVRGIGEVLSGGVFAGGGRCVIFSKEKFSDKADGGGCISVSESRYDRIAPFPSGWLAGVRAKQKQYGFRLHCCQCAGQVYKATLSFPGGRFSKFADDTVFVTQMMKDLGVPDRCRWFLEDRCIEVIRKDRGKLPGILEIMREMGYEKEDILVAGDSAEDEPALNYFPWSVKV